MVVWRIYDGKPGHDNQSRGLVNALKRQTQHLRCFDIAAEKLHAGILNLVFGRYPPGRDLDPPDLIVGAGRRTHLSLLCAKRARGGKIVVIMKPSLPLIFFDYAIIPAHDSPKPGDCILITEGAINPLTLSMQHDRGRGLILLGGPSKHYDWDGPDILARIRSILEKHPEIRWDITDSPRTPDCFSEQLAGLNDENALYHSWKDVSRDWLLQQLQNVAYTWVSEDSISMVYESLTAGTATGILSVGQRKTGKIPANIRRLRDKGMVTTYEDWLSGRHLSSPREQLDEAGRSAAWLLERLAAHAG